MRATTPLLTLALAFVAMIGMTSSGITLGFLCHCHEEVVVTAQALCAEDHSHTSDWQHLPHTHDEHEPITDEVVLIPSETLAAPSWIPLELSNAAPVFELTRDAPVKVLGEIPICPISFKSHPIQQKRHLVLII